MMRSIFLTIKCSDSKDETFEPIEYSDDEDETFEPIEYSDVEHESAEHCIVYFVGTVDTDIIEESLKEMPLQQDIPLAQNVYLDENKKLILAIMDNQNLGKLTECAQYQALLQKNLMYLAAIADAQPPTPSMPPQMSPHPTMQQGGFYTQHPRAGVVLQQPGIFPQRAPSLQFSSPRPIQDQQQQHLPMQEQMSLRPTGPSNGAHPSQNDATLAGGGGSSLPTSNPVVSGMSRGKTNQDKPDGQASGTGAGGAK